MFLMYIKLSCWGENIYDLFYFTLFIDVKSYNQQDYNTMQLNLASKYKLTKMDKNCWIKSTKLSLFFNWLWTIDVN